MAQLSGVGSPWVMATMIVAALSSMVFQPEPTLSHTYEMELNRCIYGFFIGVFAHTAYRRARPLKAMPWAWSMAELASMAAAVAFICLAAGPGTLLAPIVFAGVIFVFAQEGGRVSAVLQGGFFLWLGKLSYSISMVHITVLLIYLVGLALIGRFLGLSLVEVMPSGEKQIIGPRVVPDLLAIALLPMVWIAAWITYTVIEEPFRRLLDVSDARRADLKQAEEVAPTI